MFIQFSIAALLIASLLIGVPTLQNVPLSPDMVLVQGGRYDMGNPIEHHYFYRNEKPVHTVALPNFYIGKYEVSNGEYVQFLNAISAELLLDSVDRADDSSLGVRYKDDIYADVKFQPDSTLQLGIEVLTADGDLIFRVLPGFGAFPVTFVTWYGAKAFCQWKYENGDLPSESQWEYAARNGKYWRNSDFKYSGGDVLDSVGWYWDNGAFKVHEVGQKLPNGLGIYDLSGNLWEWIDDHWHEDYTGAPLDGTSWTEKNLKKDHNRVLRGGAWLYSKGEATTTNRWSDVPDDRHDYKGFRCVCNSADEND